MILLTLSRGKGEETVRLQLPASPAEIGETFAFLDRISLDTTATAILDVSSNVLLAAWRLHHRGPQELWLYCGNRKLPFLSTLYSLSRRVSGVPLLL